MIRLVSREKNSTEPQSRSTHTGIAWSLWKDRAVQAPSVHPSSGQVSLHQRIAMCNSKLIVWLNYLLHLFKNISTSFPPHGIPLNSSVDFNAKSLLK